MNERLGDPEIERLQKEKERLLVERSNHIWHEALKKIGPNYRNEFEIGFRTSRIGLGVNSTDKRKMEYDLFRRTLIDRAVDELVALGEKITTYSISSFLSRGKYSVVQSSISSWLLETGSKSDALNFTNISRVRNALQKVWAQPNRMQPPTNREIAKESGLTEQQVKNVFNKDGVGNRKSRNLQELREMGPKRKSGS